MSWRERLNQKEKEKAEREQSYKAEKELKISSLSKSSQPSIDVFICFYWMYLTKIKSESSSELQIPSLGLVDEETRNELEINRLEKVIIRNNLESQEELPKEKVENQGSTLSKLKASTSEAIIKNQWMPYCSEGESSRQRIDEILQIKPSKGT